MAIREGLMLGAELDAGAFSIKSDCKQAVAILNQDGVQCLGLEAIVLELKEKMNGPSCKGLNFVYREANQLAHCVAKSASFMRSGRDRNRESPFVAGVAILADLPVPMLD